MAGAIEVRLEKEDPQLLSPFTFWQAKEAPVVIVVAAFKARQRLATFFWQQLGHDGPREEDRLDFSIMNDGEFHPYKVRLADQPGYSGSLVRLRLDPVVAGSPGDWVKVKSIRLQASE